MQRHKIDATAERQLMIALIMSKEFLAQAAKVLEEELPGLREAPLFRQIAEWCIVYHQEYNTAPKAHIETIYHSWADENPDEELADDISDLLEDLSGQYEVDEALNVPFLLDTLSSFLTKRKLKSLQENLDGLLSRGDATGAINAVQGYRSVELGLDAGIDPLNDEEAWKRAFADPVQNLVEFPGAAGRFFNMALTRDALIAIQAPEKRGKTWWLFEMAARALRSRRKVAIFQVGDLSEAQGLMRLGVRMAGIPMRIDKKNPAIVVPTKIEKDDEEEIGFRLQTSEEIHPQPLTRKMVRIARKKFMRLCRIPANKLYLKFSTHPNSTINVKGIEAILDRWASELNFIPDVIIIDYADILAPEEAKKEGRDMVNDTWKAMRRLSQKRHALVITATQANAGAYNAVTQGMGNFSNDKRKLAHVTGLFALNQTDEEKEQQVQRLNWIVLRESMFNIKRCLYVGNCFALGRALCCSTL